MSITIRNKNQFVICLALAVLVPYIARLPGVAIYGPDWMTSYVQNTGIVVFTLLLNLIPGIVLYRMGRATKNVLSFRLAALGLTVGLLTLHSSLDLTADSTAVIALLFFPILAMGPMALGYGVGWTVGRSKVQTPLPF